MHNVIILQCIFFIMIFFLLHASCKVWERGFKGGDSCARSQWRGTSKIGTIFSTSFRCQWLIASLLVIDCWGSDCLSAMTWLPHMKCYKHVHLANIFVLSIAPQRPIFATLSFRLVLNKVTPLLLLHAVVWDSIQGTFFILQCKISHTTFLLLFYKISCIYMLWLLVSKHWTTSFQLGFQIMYILWSFTWLCWCQLCKLTIQLGKWL